MKISAKIIYNIPDELVKEYFPDTNPTVGDILNTIIEDNPEWENEFADYWTDWTIEEY